MAWFGHFGSLFSAIQIPAKIIWLAADWCKLKLYFSKGDGSPREILTWCTIRPWYYYACCVAINNEGTAGAHSHHQALKPHSSLLVCSCSNFVSILDKATHYELLCQQYSVYCWLLFSCTKFKLVTTESSAHMCFDSFVEITNVKALTPHKHISTTIALSYMYQPDFNSLYTSPVLIPSARSPMKGWAPILLKSIANFLSTYIPDKHLVGSRYTYKGLAIPYNIQHVPIVV